MHLENEIFKRSSIIFDKLEKYGFKKDNDNYLYEKIFLNNSFKGIISISKDGVISGKVIDRETDEEYTNIKTAMSGEFVSKVREEYKNILIDIRNNCCEDTYFISEQANRITKYIKDKYHNNPEFLWDKFKGYGIFRNSNNDKWYAIIMNIDLSKLTNSTGEVEIINVKIDKNKIPELLKQKGYYKAYHMNKADWISIILNDTIKDNEIMELIDESYNLIAEPLEWLIPANPDYYDIANCFSNVDEIIWKQSSNIKPSDIIYLYVAKPYSKIMYKCKVTEVNIPYEYKDKNIVINNVMKIKLLKKYNHDNYNFKYLNSLGIKAIRGPRKITKKISENFK